MGGESRNKRAAEALLSGGKGMSSWEWAKTFERPAEPDYEALRRMNPAALSNANLERLINHLWEQYSGKHVPEFD